MSPTAVNPPHFNPLWLPEGHHYDLHIYNRQLEDAGDFIGSGGWKMLWHTTQSKRNAVDAMFSTISDKRAAPHFIVGMRDGTQHPIVIQCVALNRAGRTLEHPDGTPETNRARCIQVEICGFAQESQTWEDQWYKVLANLTQLVEHRVDIPRVSRHAFMGENETKRLTPQGFIRAAGHLGHGHVPNNRHWDPGKLKIGTLFKCCKQPNNL